MPGGDAMYDSALLVVASRRLGQLGGLISELCPRVRRSLNISITSANCEQLIDGVHRTFSEAVRCVRPELDVKVLIDVGNKSRFDRVEGDLEDAAPIVQQRPFRSVCLGGTFDRLHYGHKLLLTTAAAMASEKVTCGVTEEAMLAKKCLSELIQPLDERIAAVRRFLASISNIECDVVAIPDPFGPSIVDAQLDCIVVSEETITGAHAVNERRVANGLAPLHVQVVPLIDGLHCAADETKLSSTALRVHSLGTLIRPVQPNPRIPDKPYVIGLTGGIASGKSNICRELETLGATVIDCDRLAHSLYAKGSPLAARIADTFGQEMMNDAGEVDRARLGRRVFADKTELARLNGLVWPAMAIELQSLIPAVKTDVVVLDAAVLVPAGWDSFVHEIWLCLVPPEEASRRIQERNALSPEQAEQRIAAQPSNRERIETAHVVFCSLWAYAETRAQVQRAWHALISRLLNPRTR